MNKTKLPGRVLIVTSGYLPAPGGSSVVFINLLANIDPSSFVVLTKSWKSGLGINEPEGYAVYRVPPLTTFVRGQRYWEPLMRRFVGLVERFDESLILMSKIFGWHRIYYLKRNVTKGRSYKREIGTETLKAIERYNELDLELYEYAEKKFEELICNHGYRLHQRLLKLKIQNLGYWGYTKFKALFLK